MRTKLLVPFALAVVAAPVAAQVTVRTAPRAYTYSMNTDQSPRAVIGVTMSSGDARDTLGLRISEVADASPAAKAGIEEGDRLQSVNGVSLKLATIDVGDQEMADAMSRRLTRELAKLKPGDNVSLVIYHGGQSKTVSLKTVDSDDLYGQSGFAKMANLDNRAVLGVSLSVSGSKRDTLGVLIIGVNDDGPAGKAGLEEGNRIASINGVNLKVDHEDAGDSYVANARYQRLQREMGKVKPGDNVTLQVYADGHFKTVQIKAEKASELTGSTNTFIFNGNGGALMPEMRLNVDGQQIRDQVQRAMDEVRESVQNLRMTPRVRWNDDEGGPEVIRMLPPEPPMPAAAPRAVMAPRGGAISAVEFIPAPAGFARAAMRAAPAPMIVGARAPLRVIRF